MKSKLGICAGTTLSSHTIYRLKHLLGFILSLRELGLDRCSTQVIQMVLWLLMDPRDGLRLLTLMSKSHGDLGLREIK
jgi:hypothetical protein